MHGLGPHLVFIETLLCMVRVLTSSICVKHCLLEEQTLSFKSNC